MSDRIVVDSSVFISSLGSPDRFTEGSKNFFSLASNFKIIVPAIVVGETAVNLAKQNPASARAALRHFSNFDLVVLDSQFLLKVTKLLTRKPKLKTSDFLIAATAKLNDAVLVTWDKRQLSKANDLCKAVTPDHYGVNP